MLAFPLLPKAPSTDFLSQQGPPQHLSSHQDHPLCLEWSPSCAVRLPHGPEAGSDPTAPSSAPPLLSERPMSEDENQPHALWGGIRTL